MTTETKELAVELAAEIARRLQPETVEQIVTLPDAARLLKMQPCSLRQMVYSGRIGYILDGKVYKFKVSELNKYLNDHYTPPKPRDMSGDHWVNPPGV